jgi:hypothetical protein
MYMLLRPSWNRCVVLPPKEGVELLNIYTWKKARFTSCLSIPIGRALLMSHASKRDASHHVSKKN